MLREINRKNTIKNKSLISKTNEKHYKMISYHYYNNIKQNLKNLEKLEQKKNNLKNLIKKFLKVAPEKNTRELIMMRKMKFEILKFKEISKKKKEKDLFLNQKLEDLKNFFLLIKNEIINMNVIKNQKILKNQNYKNKLSLKNENYKKKLLLKKKSKSNIPKILKKNFKISLIKRRSNNIKKKNLSQKNIFQKLKKTTKIFI